MPNSALRVRSSSGSSVRNDIESFWLPFTANRSFKARPRLIAGAKNMHYYTSEGRAVLDATAGLWCCNAGHSRDPIVAAIQAQAAELDFAPPISPPLIVSEAEIGEIVEKLSRVLKKVA